MTFLFILFKPILFLMVRKVFKKQMKIFAVEMMEDYVRSTDNDVDDALVARVKKAMNLGAVCALYSYK